MTNGEKLKEIFPNTKIITQLDNLFGDRLVAFTLDNAGMQVSLNWWNSEYKEPQSFKWCRDCKEYDQDKHCCHRWSKVIRDSVTEIRQELEDIRAELHATAEMHSDGDYYLREEWIDEIIDKHISGKE